MTQANSLLENSFGLCVEGPGKAGAEAGRPVKRWPGLAAAGVGRKRERIEPFLEGRGHRMGGLAPHLEVWRPVGPFREPGNPGKEG